jgi:hypothetical protein
MSGIIRAGGQVFLSATFLFGAIWVIDRAFDRLVPKVQSEEVCEEESERYEQKYMDEFLELKNSEEQVECVDPPSKIHENTPSGDVIMFYDQDLESFVYYCDNKSIPYKYLETVARKYVIDNRCVANFVDLAEEIRKAVEKRDEPVAQEPSLPSQNTVFATLKRYNQRRENQTKGAVVTEKSNRYSWRGCLAEGKSLFVNTAASPGSNAESPPQAPKKKYQMSFAEFKKKQELQSSELVYHLERDDEAERPASPVPDEGPTFVKPRSRPDEDGGEIIANERQLSELNYGM